MKDKAERDREFLLERQHRYPWAARAPRTAEAPAGPHCSAADPASRDHRVWLFIDRRDRDRFVARVPGSVALSSL